MIIVEFNKKEQKKEWNDFVIGHNGSFLQSWEWGEVMEADGRKIWRMAVREDDGKILMAALIAKYDLPFGKNCLYIPCGPVFSDFSGESFFWQEFLYKIKEIAAAENAIFLKIEPRIEVAALKSIRFFENSGFKKSPSVVQPQVLWRRTQPATSFPVT